MQRDTLTSKLARNDIPQILLFLLFYIIPIITYFVSHFMIASRLFPLTKTAKKYLLAFDILFIPLYFVVYFILIPFTEKIIVESGSFLKIFLATLLTHPIGAIIFLPKLSIPYGAGILLFSGSILWSIINWAALAHIPFLMITAAKHLNMPYKKSVLPAIKASAAAWIISFFSILIVSVLILPFIPKDVAAI